MVLGVNPMGKAKTSFPKRNLGKNCSLGNFPFWIFLKLIRTSFNRGIIFKGFTKLDYGIKEERHFFFKLDFKRVLIPGNFFNPF